MGKGSTKNERKVNPQRALQARIDEKDARLVISNLKTLRVGQRPPNYDSLLVVATGMPKKALSRQKRSENDTQSGKRGR